MLNPDFRDVLSAFVDERVEFLVVGAYALAAHGHPRATGDMDLWIRPSRQNAQRVWRALDAFGAPLSQVSPEDFQTADLIFQVGVAPNRVDVLTAIEGVDFDDAWPERLIVEIDGLAVPVIGRDHFLQNKRASGRPQDLADIAHLGDSNEP